MTISEHFDIDLEGAHDALIDVKTTRELMMKLNKMIELTKRSDRLL